MPDQAIFFDSSPQGKAVLAESGYYHVSDMTDIVVMARDHPSLEGLEGQPLREAIIDLILSEDWKVKA